MFDCTHYSICSDPICGAFWFWRRSALVSMAKRWYVYVKTTITAIRFSMQMLSHNMMTFCHHAGLLRFTSQRQKHRTRHLHWSQNSKRCVDQQYVVIFHLTLTQQQHNLASAKTSSMFSTNNVWCVYCYVAWESDVKRGYAKSDLSSVGLKRKMCISFTEMRI